MTSEGTWYILKDPVVFSKKKAKQCESTYYMI